MTNGLTCNVLDCVEIATHRAEMVIYGAVAVLHRPAIAYIDLRVCTAHATEARAQELMTDAGKKQIEKALAQAGKARPDWGRSFARWVSTEGGRDA